MDTLLVGADAFFWSAARADIAAAKVRVLVQAMTFEADAAGRPVAQAVDASAAADRRVLVDDYSRHVVNDHVVAATRDPAIRREARDTKAMFDALVARGVGVRVTNPIGRNPARYAVRNHKKLIVADDVAYIGGINFSDHNFAWHDMIIRIAVPQAVDFLAADFDATWAGRPTPSQARFGAVTPTALDGRDNTRGFAGTLAAIAGARASIDMVSAYPTFPFVDALATAARRGVRVRLVHPAAQQQAGGARLCDPRRRGRRDRGAAAA
ncbi:phospholipase D-like domain-containing protein [Sphingomonas sp. MMS24-JH45]